MQQKIFFYSWIEGMKDEKQETDVHYKYVFVRDTIAHVSGNVSWKLAERLMFYVRIRSMTGEGNFNWRLIFPFNYQRAEERIIITRKVTHIKRYCLTLCFGFISLSFVILWYVKLFSEYAFVSLGFVLLLGWIWRESSTSCRVTSLGCRRLFSRWFYW